MAKKKKRSTWRHWAAGGAAAAALTGFAHAETPEPPQEPQRPNILFIIADDLGYTDLGCYGNDYHLTPNLDSLARDGMKFQHAYVHPNCAPTRACLMTGQHTPRHGIYTVGSPERGREEDRRVAPPPNVTTLPLETPTIAEVLNDAGYFTAHLGKWHLGNPDTHGPEQQGFDVNVGGYIAGTPPGGYFVPYENPYLEDGPEGEYLTDRLTDEAIELIREPRDEPFFIYLSHYAPHTPIEAKEEDIAFYEDREPGKYHDHPVYAGMIHAIDEGAGRILTALDDMDLTDNTAVFFYSDNGQHEGYSNALPWRGNKGSFYEGGIRVPLIVRWPGVVEPGSECAEPVQHIDFFPTLAEMVGAETPNDHIVDGLSFLELLQSSGEGRLDRDALFWHFPGYLEAYRPQLGPWRTTPVTVMRAGDWKLFEYYEGNRLELYNLAYDPYEQNDLSRGRPDKAEELHARMRAWRETVDAPMPTPK